MSKEYFVLRGCKVVHEYGHYDIEGARRTADLECRMHPAELVHIVKIEESYIGDSISG